VTEASELFRTNDQNASAKRKV